MNKGVGEGKAAETCGQEGCSRPFLHWGSHLKTPSDACTEDEKQQRHGNMDEYGKEASRAHGASSRKGSEEGEKGDSRPGTRLSTERLETSSISLAVAFRSLKKRCDMPENSLAAPHPQISRAGNISIDDSLKDSKNNRHAAVFESRTPCSDMTGLVDLD